MKQTWNYHVFCRYNEPSKPRRQVKGNLGHVVEIDVGRNLYSDDDGDGDGDDSNSNALTTILISSPVPAKLQREKTNF